MSKKISEEEKIFRNCPKPKLTVKRKPCGCASESTCSTCGLVDRFPEDHHMEECKVANKLPYVRSEK